MVRVGDVFLESDVHPMWPFACHMELALPSMHTDVDCLDHLHVHVICQPHSSIKTHNLCQSITCKSIRILHLCQSKEKVSLLYVRRFQRGREAPEDPGQDAVGRRLLTHTTQPQSSRIITNTSHLWLYLRELLGEVGAEQGILRCLDAHLTIKSTDEHHTCTKLVTALVLSTLDRIT